MSKEKGDIKNLPAQILNRIRIMKIFILIATEIFLQLKPFFPPNVFD